MAKFGNATQEENPVQIVSTVSPDGSAISLLFSFLSTNSGRLPGKDNRISTYSVSFKIPLTDNSKDLHVKNDIRGFVRTPEGTKATLFMHLCGKTTVINWPNSNSPNENFIETVMHTLPKGKEYLGTLFLLTERDSENVEEALFAFDTLDITIVDQKAK